jgi:hypothetical protein
MKKKVLVGVFLVSCFLIVDPCFSYAQCSVCTKTTQQLGEEPAKGLNAGILYLMFAPFAIMGYVGFRWWKNNREDEDSL